MGNANGREEGGSGSLSEVEDVGGVQVSMADHGAHGNYHAHGGDYMGQSPPPSPRASNSPLMFRPQMPAVPLQRPNELHIPSPSWMQTSSGYEDLCNEQGIPTMITWCYGGKEVSVVGSWDDWKSRKPLQKSGTDFTIMKVLPSGVYQYRFIVDGQWRQSPDQPCEQDESGDVYNILDLQDYVPEDVESISGFLAPESPDSSYNNSHLGHEDFAKEPPMVPPHLNTSLLYVPRPQHVVLNHVYMQADMARPEVVALASTNRFLSKYVTVVLYKSMQR